MIIHTRTMLVAGLAVFLLLAQQLADAQEEPQIDEGGYKLTLAEIPEVEAGKVSLISGNANTDGDKFFLEHLTMFQPVKVSLIAADPARPVRINLAKYRYGEVAWSGETDSKGIASHDFRTQGELKIHVTPADGQQDAAYGLIVWVADLPGPEIAPPPPIVSADEAQGGMPIWLMILAGLGLLIVIALVFFKLGSRK